MHRRRDEETMMAVGQGPEHLEPGHSRTSPDWLRPLRAVRMSLDPTRIVLGTLGLILLHAGWMAIDRVFPDASFAANPLASIPVLGPESLFDDGRGTWEWIRGRGDRLLGPARALTIPLFALFSRGKDIGWYLHSMLALVCSILVWGIIGGAICRITIFQSAGRPGPGVLGSLRFALRHWQPLVLTPLGPLFLIGMCALPCAAIGLFFRIPGGIGALLGSALLIIPLLAGLGMSILLVYLLLGWPLLHATVAAQGEDLLDAASRSLAYVNYRFGRVLVWIGMAFLIGIPALWFIDIVASETWALAMWGLSLSAPPGSLPLPSIEAMAELQAPSRLFGFWWNLVGMVAGGWIPAYFWTSSSLLYLELRLDVDGTPRTEINQGEDASRSAPNETNGKTPVAAERPAASSA